LDPAATASPDPAAAASPDPAAAASPDPAAAASPDPAPAASPGPAVAAAEAKPKPKPKPRPSNIVLGLCFAVIGVVIVAVIVLFTPTPTRDQDIPYLLEPLEKHLDAHLRYRPPVPQEQKDWRNDLIVEQNIWTTEVSKIMLGRPDAKPIEFKRDYLFYLGDSYFKDEPHFAEAKAAYLTANVTRRAAHEKAYDYSDDELFRRIGYCDIRLGFYDEAEEWLKKALKVNEDATKIKPDMALTGTHNRIVDNLAENYSRKGQPKQAEELMQQRLRAMDQKSFDDCVELSMIYNLALAKEREGDLKQSEHFYKLAIKLCQAEDLKRGVVVPESISDGNRALARVLMNYSHMLRLAHRNDEAINAMHRALVIYDNPPQQ
jgi:tetratricopeptide (TPR) repeat protein